MDGQEVVDLLRGIWGEMKSLNGRIDRVRVDLGARIDQTNARLEAGFSQMDRRFDQFLLGEHGREHREFRERLARLEIRTGLPPLTVP